MERTSAIVHFGAGRLGLGLVLPIVSRCRLDVLCANSPASNPGSAHRHTCLARDKSYWVLVRESGNRSEVAIADFVVIDDSSIERLGSIIEDPRTVLVTCAMGCSRLEAFVPTLQTLLHRRSAANPGDPLFVIACENTTEDAYESLRRSRLPGVHFLECVVDRICYRVEVRPTDGPVEVEVERHARWTIQLPPSVAPEHRERLTTLLAPAIATGEVVVVEAIGPDRAKKRWLVNGPHLALSILARASLVRPYVYLDEFMLENPGIVRQVMDEYVDRLVLEGFGIDPAEYEAYAETTVARFAKNPDEIDRIMRRFQRKSLEEFLRLDLFPKLCMPAEALARRPGAYWPTGITQAVHECLRMISRGNDFVVEEA